MFISEDGTVTGSVDVSKLDEIEPKSDEARAQLDRLKADAKAGQEQATRDAERVNEQAQLQHEQLHGSGSGQVADNRDVQGKSVAPDQPEEADQKAADQAAQKAADQKAADQGSDPKATTTGRKASASGGEK